MKLVKESLRRKITKKQIQRKIGIFLSFPLNVKLKEIKEEKDSEDLIRFESSFFSKILLLLFGVKFYPAAYMYRIMEKLLIKGIRE